MSADGSGFGRFVAAAHKRGELVVQPRMGFAEPHRMRAGLEAVRATDATTVGTLTLDSYTRVNAPEAARRDMDAGRALNGYPLLTHSQRTTSEVLAGIHDTGFPVQVRHGAARPQEIIAGLVGAGLDATEGGPISYCLPYSRMPLDRAVGHWSEGCALLAEAAGHLESFGGCVLGQLCPPGLLVAVSVLEGLFSVQHGMRSISLSYAQQTDPGQDAAALAALGRLSEELLAGVERHIVLYAYMGVHPRTRIGCTRLLQDAAALAVRGGAARLVVKTPAEAFRIPTVAENVSALEVAARAAEATRSDPAAPPEPVDGFDAIYHEARAIIYAVLDIDTCVRKSLVPAFARGLLDIPYCLHPDNAGRTRATIDGSGRLRWTRTGALPIPPSDAPDLSSDELITVLNRVANRYDGSDRGTSRSTLRGPAPRPDAVATPCLADRAAASRPIRSIA